VIDRINQIHKIYNRYRNQANMEWDDHDFYDANTHLLVNLHNLKICHKCFQLHGKIWLENGPFVKQKCHCESKDEEPWHISSRDFSSYNDFNKKYEICYCCGLEVIPSGSKWSSFYCQDCKGRIYKLNEKFGQCIIPYGRHSLMNGISLSGENAQDREAIDQFVSSVNKMNRSIDIVEEHRKAVVKKWVEFLQLGDEARAMDLIVKSDSIELDELKKESFIELLALSLRKTVDEAERFYQDFLEDKWINRFRIMSWLLRIIPK